MYGCESWGIVGVASVGESGTVIGCWGSGGCHGLLGCHGFYGMSGSQGLYGGPGSRMF